MKLNFNQIYCSITLKISYFGKNWALHKKLYLEHTLVTDPPEAASAVQGIHAREHTKGDIALIFPIYAQKFSPCPQGRHECPEIKM